MAEQLSKAAIDLEPLPQARVVYNPEQDLLLIESGATSAVGEEMAEGIIVHYNKDDEAVPADETVRAVAILIDGAEYVLKPFVDAILAKYGVKAESPYNGHESGAIPKASADS